MFSDGQNSFYSLTEVEEDENSINNNINNTDNVEQITKQTQQETNLQNQLETQQQPLATQPSNIASTSIAQPSHSKQVLTMTGEEEDIVDIDDEADQPEVQNKIDESAVDEQDDENLPVISFYDEQQQTSADQTTRDDEDVDDDDDDSKLETYSLNALQSELAALDEDEQAALLDASLAGLFVIIFHFIVKCLNFNPIFSFK